MIVETTAVEDPTIVDGVSLFPGVDVEHRFFCGGFYPGFTEADLRTPSGFYEPSRRDAARVAGLVELATENHADRHHGCIHPWCYSCELENVGATDPERFWRERAGAVARCHDRAAWYLEQHRGSVPPDPTPDEWLELTAASSGLDAEMLDRDQLDQLPELDWLVDDAITRHSIVILSGRHGTKKSLIAQGLSASLASNTLWLDRDTAGCRVLYVAGEGAYGLLARFAAWETAWQRRIPSDQLTVLPRAVNLYRGGADLDAFVDYVREGEYGLVVIDTLRRASSGADENSARDMGLVIDALERIKRATDDGSVLVIAHTGKSDKDSRGSSVIEDDADVVWHVESDDYRTTLKNTKMKDGPDGLEIHLRAREHAGSLVMESFTEPPVKAGGDVTPNESRVLSILATTFDAIGASWTDLFKTCEDGGMAKSSFSSALNGLVKRGLVERRERRYFPVPGMVQEVQEARDAL